MVGSCNCLWLKRHPLVCGSIIVINPVTGESLHIPSPPLATSRSRHAGMISFGYHSTTGKYKIVHFPSNGGLVDEVTLGGTASSSSPSRHGGGNGDGVVNILTLGDDTTAAGGARWGRRRGAWHISSLVHLQLSWHTPSTTFFPVLHPSILATCDDGLGPFLDGASPPRLLLFLAAGADVVVDAGRAFSAGGRVYERSAASWRS
ncbi:hypothetical protein OsI_26647 [Oryza sativa Indica Group]|uniref:Uncharacterized protein n=1 Tax=Oryza sativa subsp. indica TaxID=39946 RepID=A2YN37_ORYSI|nr:hypothetical protein OsI_26647 [Oryza sativa Indica Group]